MNYENILELLLDKGCLTEYCNIRQPLRPMKKNIWNFLFCLILILIGSAAYLIFVGPYYYDVINYCMLGALFLMILLYFIVVFKHPGFIGLRIF